MGPVLYSLVGSIVDEADASAPTLVLNRSSSLKDLSIAAAQRGDITKKGTAYKMQFPANDMMSGRDMSHTRSAHEFQFPANDMMSGGEGRQINLFPVQF